MTNPRPAREIAVRALLQRERTAEFIEDLLAKELARQPVDPIDRGLIQELTYGATRHQATLDWLIARKTQGRTQKEALQILLRLGLYQLFWLTRVPDHAAVHETVALAKSLGFGPQAGFVNAVLRGYLRERVATTQVLQDLRGQDPALACSHPSWLYERWQQRWGRDRAMALMEWNNQPPTTFARINRLRVEPVEAIQAWTTEGVRFEPVAVPWVPAGLIYRLTSHPAFATMPSFRAGWFYVQDPSTLLAVAILNPKPNERILDLCAAPGGKAAYTAQLIQNQGHILAEDLHPDRLKLIEENCARLGLSCVRTRLISAPEPDHRFDRVLVDAPCSNTGVMRRRVDLRWRIQPRELERLQADQLRLLERAAAQVRVGGAIVYSTCSLEPEENSDVVRLFLQNRSGYRLVHERQLLPFADGFDGAYVAQVEKLTELSE